MIEPKVPLKGAPRGETPASVRVSARMIPLEGDLGHIGGLSEPLLGGRNGLRRPQSPAGEPAQWEGLRL